MLKRQRPSSPFLPSSVPFISDSPDDLIDRNSKRRRTIPPVLDGSSRGWASPPPHLEEDEEYFDDEYTSSYNQNLDQNREKMDLKSEYKSANAILRELHVLHQHRLSFSPSDTASRSTSHTHPPTSNSAPVLFQSEGSLLMEGCLQSPPQGHPPAAFTHTSMAIEKDVQHDVPLLEEVNRVTERYESTNRLLGSLFLSRRRVLDSSDDISGR